MDVRTDGRWAGVALVALASVCFATLGTATRFAADAGVGPLPFITWRAAIGAVAVGSLLVLVGARGRAVLVPVGSIPARQRVALAGGVLAGALVNLGLFFAFVRISIALTLLIFYTYPTLVAIVSAARFGEPFDRLRIAALGASVVGLVLVFAGAGELGALDVSGLAFAFLTTFAQTFYVLATRHGFASVPSGQAVAATLAGGAFFYLAVAAVLGTLPEVGQPLSSATGLALVLFAGTIGAAVPTLAFITGIRRLGAPRAAILATLEPVVAVALAAVLLSEIPSPLQVLGGALVIAGGVLSQLGGEPTAEHEAVAEAATPR